MWIPTNVPNQREAYQLDITNEGVVLIGARTAGVLYGVQTLIQLLEPAATANWEGPVWQRVMEAWEGATHGETVLPTIVGVGGQNTSPVPACRVTDWPDSELRGINMFGVVAKNYTLGLRTMDVMSYCKMKISQLWIWKMLTSSKPIQKHTSS
eukprot:TRINITY_DN67664_c9_g2_i1.p1 TRINITY_DN67664_c9_g2~~TRINITY_DN67664_c9_g2_i1.p1  ORF type:complete len:174 (+),score=19.27 TRINITY_DN67664_c9_g2_i1:65-523(+)